MIELINARLQLGSKVLLEAAELCIFPKHKVGIVGRNGCGKSSLFKLFTHQVMLDEGSFRVPKDWQVASVKQETPALDCPAISYVLAGDKALHNLQEKLNKAEQNQDNHAIAELHQAIDNIDGYSAKARASALLHGLGFSQQEQTQAVKSFSGGWRMRLNLAQALMCRADLLLLDEPTNHLDMAAVVWLEQWLKSYQGTLLIVSHDRDFLDSVVHSIAHIDQKRISLYSGNFSSFETTRAMQLNQIAAEAEKNRKKREHLERFVNRFKAKASKAKQAQSRIKMLEKMGDTAVVNSQSQIQFSFFDAKHKPNQLLRLEQGVIGYGKTALVQAVNVSIQAQDRIGILGSNGAGKSTLLKTLGKKQHLLEGNLEINKHCLVGYFDQHQLDVLDSNASAFTHLQRLSPEATEQSLRNFIGGFGFHGDLAMEPIEAFSGGERARLAIALIVWQKPNILLLDEPTNHLDIEARMALTLALQNFSGAIITISHDRYLLNAICDQFLVIKDHHLLSYDGSLEDYQSFLLTTETSTNAKKDSKTESRKDLKRKEAEQRQALAPLNKQSNTLEKKLAKLEADLASTNEQLNDPLIYTDEFKQKLQDLLQKQRTLNQEQQQVESEWLAVHEEIENIKAQWDQQ